jgi:hypothetical protein
MFPEFQQFIAVDWSGAQGPRLPGLQVAVCTPGRGAPRLIYPGREWLWTRRSLFDHLLAAAKENGPILAGFDMSVAFPFCDLSTYFPGAPERPENPFELWQVVDECCRDEDDFYARPFALPGRPFADYFNTAGHRGAKYDNKRLRVTDEACLKWTRPSSVFNGVGPGSVGTGSLAGMRFFHAMKQQREVRVAIWPFDEGRGDEPLVLCEIFPRVYMKLAGQDPRTWREPGFLNHVLRSYKSATPAANRNYSEDELDALFSAAAVRNLACVPSSWRPDAMTDCAARYEGWIFGVT